MRRYLAGLALLLAAAPASVAMAAERPRVEVACHPAGDRLAYRCVFEVRGRKSGDPVDGAVFTVHADMPTMAMAHNVRPVTPEATGEPGVYAAVLQLEMHGEWALKLTFREPVRDIVIKKLEFGGKAGQMPLHRKKHSE